MQYRDQEFRYDAEHLCDAEADLVRQLTDGKQYHPEAVEPAEATEVA